MNTLMSDCILRVSNLSKSYAGVPALREVQFELRRGEVLALMGENGAGKSTLMKILAGLVEPDSGQIELDGAPFSPRSVREVLTAGISMIHQEILMVPELTVAQNLFLGREKTRYWKRWVDSGAINREAAALLEQLDLQLDPATPMKQLSVAQMQLVEIARAVSNESRIIIMDEPTSAISDREVDVLFRIIGRLKARGVSIIYISHKMDEIFRIADTITVFRDGRYVLSKPASELDNPSLIRLMVGRELDALFPENHAARGPVLLRVEKLSRRPAFRDVSFDLHKGEVLGIAGLMGAGRTEVARAIYGLDTPDSGRVEMEGADDRPVRNPSEALNKGIGYVSEDRKALGLVTGLSVRQNLTLSSLEKYARYRFVRHTGELEAVAEITKQLQIKTTGPGQKVRDLSGGNQQKIAIGKVLLASPRVIILDEPTRGIDIGAKFEIYKLIRRLAAEGLGIILISSELPEIIGMSDRVLVMSQGRQTALLDRSDITQETIMSYAVPH